MRTLLRAAGIAAFLSAYTAIAATPAMPASQSDAGTPASLKAKHVELREAFARNDFQRPLHLDSVEVTEKLRGNVYAQIDHPFARLSEALRSPANWCEILVLPMHVRRCSAADSGKIALAVASRPQADADTVELKFDFRVVQATAEHFQIQMSASEGPIGTRDYRILLEAIPLEANRTFVHLSYAYAYGSAAKLATQAYLGTSGRDKVGFTVEEQNGQRRPVGGMRGILERNVMRYFLAIDAYLDSLAAPPAQRLEKRLQAWAASLARYPRQLREAEPDYLALKREQMAKIKG